MNDNVLAELFMCACRDKDEIEIANTVYWWCVKEINTRIKLEGINDVN